MTYIDVYTITKPPSSSWVEWTRFSPCTFLVWVIKFEIQGCFCSSFCTLAPRIYLVKEFHFVKRVSSSNNISFLCPSPKGGLGLGRGRLHFVKLMKYKKESIKRLLQKRKTKKGHFARLILQTKNNPTKEHISLAGIRSNFIEKQNDKWSYIIEIINGTYRIIVHSSPGCFNACNQLQRNLC